MKANKGFKTTKKTHLFATRGFLTFLVKSETLPSMPSSTIWYKPFYDTIPMSLFISPPDLTYDQVTKS